MSLFPWFFCFFFCIHSFKLHNINFKMINGINLIYWALFNVYFNQLLQKKCCISNNRLISSLLLFQSLAKITKKFSQTSIHPSFSIKTDFFSNFLLIPQKKIHSILLNFTNTNTQKYNNNKNTTEHKIQNFFNYYYYFFALIHSLSLFPSHGFTHFFKIERKQKLFLIK